MKWRLFEGILKNFWGFVRFWKPMEFWWIIFGIFLGSWTGLGGFGIWKRRIISARNTKIRFSSHFGPPETKNRKLVRKIKLDQGWPKNGVQIRKSQNTEEPGKSSPNHQISTESWPENQGDLLRSKDHSKFPGLDQFGLSIQLWLSKSSSLSSADKKNSLPPWSGPVNKITSKSWGRAKRWLRSWQWVGRRDIIHLESQTHRRTHRLLTRGIPACSFTVFFALNHQTGS